jgi:hypothetical protein
MPKNNHPHIQALYEYYQKESQAFRKVHRMIDLFESIIKTYTVVILSEYIKQNKLSDSAKGLLSQGLRTPSLGTWQLFSRVLFEELQKDNYTWLVEEFPQEFLFLDKALNNEKTNVIALRNGYAHGATPTDAQCEEDIKKFEPFLTQLIASKWLNASSLQVRDNKVYLVGSEGELCLHPILLYRNEESAVSFAFFNDIKNDKIGLLNYPLSKHYREKDFYTEFHEHLPLNDWKKSGNNEFYQRIEELTETFKGRTAEREQLLSFVEDKNKGYFSIQGNPGIGKSALIAQFFKDLRVNEKLKHIQVVEYFIRRGTAQAKTDYLLNYLIKRTDELFPQGREIRAEDKNTWSLQQQLFSKWRLWAEHSKGNKLLFLIDGLDEGVEDDLVKYLPRENFENILIIYGSRPGGHRSIDELWSTLPIEYHTKLELSGLSKQDIRALIYEVANKYALERESAWIDAVEKRSQGNPLYLKLLCDALENGSVELNDINALPEKIEDYYKAILQRYAQDTLDGDALLAGLYTFAAAKDYLTMTHLGLINKLGDAQVERVGSTLKEVLYENPLTEDVLDYQLFHESFREYLVKEKNMQVLESVERIIDFCATWQDLEGTIEQRYTLENYAPHLSESKKEFRHNELLALFQNEVYTTTQKKVLKQFDATKKLYQLGLLKAGEVKENDEQLDAALCLVDLKYEEANDALQIVALVANNEIDLALKRIESFGGLDKEGVKRKFIIYMLCFMELTLLESKNKPFRKYVIEKLLKHLDKFIPIDHSVLNWNEIFPSYLMFKISCEITKLGLDYSIFYSRTKDWEKDWINNLNIINETEFEVLIESTQFIISIKEKNLAKYYISLGMNKQVRIKENQIYSLNQNEINNVQQNDKKRNSNYYRLIDLIENQKNELLFEELISMKDDWDKNLLLKDISIALAKLNKKEEAIKCIYLINSERTKIKTLAIISTEFEKQGRVDYAQYLINLAIEYTYQLSSNDDIKKTLIEISFELSKQNKFDETFYLLWEILKVNSGVDSEIQKSRILVEVCKQLFTEGNKIKSTSCAKSIKNKWEYNNAFSIISSENAKQGNIEEAIFQVQNINDEWLKSSALSAISKELTKIGEIDKALHYVRIIASIKEKDNTLEFISKELIKGGDFEKAIDCIDTISDTFVKSNSLAYISSELVIQGYKEEAMKFAEKTSDYYVKSIILKNISNVEAIKGSPEEALVLINEAIKCMSCITDEWDKIISLKVLIIELLEQNHIEVAGSLIDYSLECVKDLDDELDRVIALKDIYFELTKYQNLIEVEFILNEVIKRARSLDDKSSKSSALKVICKELMMKNNWQTAENIGIEIPLLAERFSCWKELAIYNLENEEWKKALDKVEKLKNEEARLFYLKGWVENIHIKDSTFHCLQEALPLIEKDSDSIETLLQKYAINQLFFGDVSKEQINRLNKTLNIQWAIDIKNQFPSSEEIQRQSTNVEAWLHEIADEDNRDDIVDWAKRVKDGKWTEEKFQERLKEKL